MIIYVYLYMWRSERNFKETIPQSNIIWSVLVKENKQAKRRQVDLTFRLRYYYIQHILRFYPVLLLHQPSVDQDGK